MNTGNLVPKRHPWPVVVLVALVGFVAYSQDTPKKVTRAEAASAVASRIQPEYPPMARQLRIEGMVELEATIAETGEVTNVRIVSGNAILTDPAARAVKRWRFKPFMEDGKAVRVLAPVAIDFKL